MPLFQKLKIAIIIAFPKKSIVNTSDNTNPNYCQELCFDIIYKKTLVFIIIISVIIITALLLVIMGCFKKDDSPEADHTAMKNLEGNENKNSLQISNI